MHRSPSIVDRRSLIVDHRPSIIDRRPSVVDRRRKGGKFIIVNVIYSNRRKPAVQEPVNHKRHGKVGSLHVCELIDITREIAIFRLLLSI